MDDYENVTERAIRRNRHLVLLHRAMQRTESLLNSIHAKEQPELERVWKERLQRQQTNLYGLCK